MVNKNNPLLKNLTGQKFGRLTVIKRADNDKTGHVRWYCNCDCGNKNIIVYKDALLSGRQISCGCYLKELKSKELKGKRKGNKYLLNGEYGIGYTNKGEFLFDLEDYDKIKDFTWRIDALGYVVSFLDRKVIYLHRIVMGVEDKSIDIDHIHHNRADNRKKELRISTHRENLRNRKKSCNNSTGYIGVYKTKNNTYNAKISKINLGCFKTLQEAVSARRNAEKELYGEFAYDYSDEKSQDNKSNIFINIIDNKEIIKRYCINQNDCSECDFYEQSNNCFFLNKTPKDW